MHRQIEFISTFTYHIYTRLLTVSSNAFK